MNGQKYDGDMLLAAVYTLGFYLAGKSYYSSIGKSIFCSFRRLQMLFYGVLFVKFVCFAFPDSLIAIILSMKHQNAAQ